MECRKFEITVISAYNLEDVRKICCKIMKAYPNPGICKMNVYARVSVGGSPEKEKRSPTDYDGGANPAWNFTTSYTISESMVQHYNNMLVVKLFCKRRLVRDRYIGEVHTSVKELFDCAKSTGGSSAVLTFPVQKGSVGSQGGLKFSYRFGEKVLIENLLLAESVVSASPRVN